MYTEDLAINLTGQESGLTATTSSFAFDFQTLEAEPNMVSLEDVQGLTY